MSYDNFNDPYDRLPDVDYDGAIVEESKTIYQQKTGEIGYSNSGYPSAPEYPD